MHREARRSTRKRSNQVRGCRSRKSDFDILKIRIKVASVRYENCGSIHAVPDDFGAFVTDSVKISINYS